MTGMPVRRSILLLDLKTPLAYSNADEYSVRSRFGEGTTPVPLPSGVNADEGILVFPVSCVFDTQDGPRSSDDVAPVFAGFSVLAHGGTLGTDGSYVIPSGEWSFWQTEANEFEVRDAIEFFAREAWWTGARCEGPYIVRFVREDGHTALQVLRRRSRA